MVFMKIDKNLKLADIIGSPARTENMGIVNLPDDKLEKIMKLPDIKILRASYSINNSAIVESNRRLRDALHNEEVAIKWLTFCLAIFTIVFFEH